VSRPAVGSTLRRFRRAVTTASVGLAVVAVFCVGVGPDVPVLGHADLLNGAGVGVIVLFAGFAFLASSALAWVQANAHRRFERVTDPQAVYATPMVSSVPQFARPPGGHTALPMLTHPADEAAESYRTLATVLRARRGESPVLVVAISSAAVGAGVTTTVANCGLALAEMGERVLVVDGDPLHRGLTQALVEDTDATGLGLPPMGLSELLEGRPLPDTMFPALGGTGLVVVPSGRSTDMAVHRWRSSTLRAALTDLSRRFDMILFDTPPIGTSSFSLDLAGVARRLVLVVPHQDLVESHQLVAHRLLGVDIEVFGYVYNNAPSNARFASYFPVVRGDRHHAAWDADVTADRPEPPGAEHDALST
jgi:Mrp family chromosome partitioning ATPase